ncbi:MAG: ATP-binding protein [Aquabacterium sp.]
MPFSSPSVMRAQTSPDDAEVLALREEVVALRAQLKQREAGARRMLHQILDRMPGAVAYWDTDLVLRFCNPLLMRHWAHKPQPLIGQPMSAVLSEQGLARTLPHVHEALAGRESSGEHVEHGMTAHVRYSPVIEDGVVQGFIVMAVDVSELKNARAAAEQASRAKSEFLASMSHEIRTPLNAVLGFAQLGAMRFGDHPSAEPFRHILTSGQLLLGLINDVLDFSRIEAGKLSLHPGEMVLDDCIERGLDIVREQARDKGLDLLVERHPATADRWQADAVRVEQILVNLLTNAVKFTERGEVRLKVWADEEGLRLRVADTGPGMAPEVMARLFKPFEQGDASSTRRAGGTGLGLSICKRLAEMMGGDIRVCSAPGQGARFDVVLPLTPWPELVLPSQEAAPLDWHEWGLQGVRVLVAEDHSVNQLLIGQLLDNVGAVMTCVGNGEEAVLAVAEAGAGAFDLMLCDIEMPVMDGLEATRRIRRIDPGLPVLGLTAHAFEHARQQGLAAGMLDYILKPFRHEVLMGLMAQHARRTPAE